jgi:probable phosphoglycerate mutase
MAINKMKLFLVRHAETPMNKNKIMQGRLDISISKKGRIQAGKLAKRLVKEKIDIIFCSNMKRCRETITPLLKLKKIPIIYTKDLRERDFGIFEGKPIEKYATWVRKNKLNRYINLFLFRIKKGESLIAVKRRVNKVMGKIFSLNKRNILIVTHGATTKVALISALKQSLLKDYRKYSISNTGLSIITSLKKGNPKLKLLNCTKHLK